MAVADHVLQESRQLPPAARRHGQRLGDLFQGARTGASLQVSEDAVTLGHGGILVWRAAAGGMTPASRYVI
ncbi:MAG: hypothetical protein OXU61_10960 [Gammaproteobacteria bacterium]|nr:hypothetical protein [Gammaproteobacteria bacterium]